MQLRGDIDGHELWRSHSLIVTSWRQKVVRLTDDRLPRERERESLSLISAPFLKGRNQYSRKWIIGDSFAFPLLLFLLPYLTLVRLDGSSERILSRFNCRQDTITLTVHRTWILELLALLGESNLGYFVGDFADWTSRTGEFQFRYRR